ncbi:hypothetical protein CRG98_034552 [Punica granatum]|uniref:Uncharacterized protein n=1 Tax=Punica granatum TaxID=22663 RepID=A0A2I0IM28_PUNGR|nr:hypothetical protein CRG98_034552 [Punica granatum]
MSLRFTFDEPSPRNQTKFHLKFQFDETLKSGEPRSPFASSIGPSITGTTSSGAAAQAILPSIVIVVGFINVHGLPNIERELVLLVAAKVGVAHEVEHAGPQSRLRGNCEVELHPRTPLELSLLMAISWFIFVVME